MHRKNFLFKLIAVILAGILIFFIKDMAVRVATPLLEQISILRQHLFVSSSQETLIKENEQLRASLFELDTLRENVASLRRALNFKDAQKLSMKGGRVITYGKELGREYLIIDQGKEAGITKNEAVIDESLLFIGTVIEVQNGYSKVEVASSNDATTEGTLLPSHTKAGAKGIGGRTFDIQFIPNTVPVRRGDFIAFPASPSSLIPMGQITDVSQSAHSIFQNITATLISHPETVQNVYIITSP